MSLVARGKRNGVDHIGPEEPSLKYSGLTWFDTVNDTLKIWRTHNNTWRDVDAGIYINFVTQDNLGPIGLGSA